MAIEFKETFRVAAPIERVWEFLLKPENVVACMPGASLTRVVDEKSFIGTVKLKIGAVTAQYQGTITYADPDAASHKVKLLAEGNERGGGTVSGTIATHLVPLPGAEGTEVRVQSSIDLTGRILQVGRGMIEGVSAQIIKKYIGNVKAALEVTPTPTPPASAAAASVDGAAAPASSAGAPAGLPTQSPAAAATAPVRKDDSINVVAVVFTVLRERMTAFFRRLLGRR